MGHTPSAAVPLLFRFHHWTKWFAASACVCVWVSVCVYARLRCSDSRRKKEEQDGAKSRRWERRKVERKERKRRKEFLSHTNTHTHTNTDCIRRCSRVDIEGMTRLWGVCRERERQNLRNNGRISNNNHWCPTRRRGIESQKKNLGGEEDIMISCPQQKLQPPISLKKKQKKRHGNRENMVVVLVGETLRGSPPQKSQKKLLIFPWGWPVFIRCTVSLFVKKNRLDGRQNKGRFGLVFVCRLFAPHKQNQRRFRERVGCARLAMALLRSQYGHDWREQDRRPLLFFFFFFFVFFISTLGFTFRFEETKKIK